MEALLDAAKSLPVVKQRVVAAIVGGLVADAASKLHLSGQARY